VSENDLEGALNRLVPPKKCLVIGLGNADRADDGLGLIISEKLKARFPSRAFSERESPPENIVLDHLNDEKVKGFLFIDAMDFGGRPGTFRIFTWDDASRFVPSLSTHKVPMTLIMSIINQHDKVPLLLGVQPESVELMGELTEPVKHTLVRLESILERWLEQNEQGEKTSNESL